MQSVSRQRHVASNPTTFLAATPPSVEDADYDEQDDSAPAVDVEVIQDVEVMKFASEEEKKDAVGNLVEDDEWMGLTMELTELIRLSVIEDVKKNARDFLGSDQYKIGDISKEIDVRVKREVALLRGKDDYELGDLVLAADEMSKKFTEELTGKPYKAGDLSVELDTRIKSAVAQFCGKDTYVVGDLTYEISRRVKSGLKEFTGKDYEFGDVSRELNSRRKAWMKNTLGEDALENYEFGDLSKKAISSFTGKSEYAFGDVSKKIAANLFGKRKRGGEN